MDEKPKSIWKKSWTGRSAFRLWIIIVGAATGLGLVLLSVASFDSNSSFDKVFGMAALVVFASVAICALWFYILRPLLCWLCCWRNLKRSLFALACFATLIALFYAEENWRGKRAWENYKREWEAKGERFDFASIVPKPVPDDQNFALTPVIAGSYETYFDKSGREVRPRNTNVVDRLSMITWRDNHWAHPPEAKDWQVSKKTDLIAWQEYFRSLPPTNSVETNSFPITPQPQSPADDILLALSKYDSAIEEIRQASTLPYSRFPLTYDQENNSSILLPHLAALKSCAQALNLRALVELKIGQDATALKDLKLALYLANSIRTEPFLISQLVRISIMQNSLQSVWEGLAEHQWSEQTLDALDAEFAKLDFLADYKMSMRGELGCQSGIIEYLRRHPEQFINLSGDFFDDNRGNDRGLPITAKIFWQLIPNGWFFQNQFHCSRMMVEFNIPLVDMDQRTVSLAAVLRANKFLSADTKTSMPYNLLARMLVPDFGSAAKKFACAQTSADFARTALALEHYRLAHGEFPESLDALTPQFLEKIPHDVIGGQPLKYRRTSDGQFVLYSVGWNERDDGGVVVFKKDSSTEVDINQGDWVWRYPHKE